MPISVTRDRERNSEDSEVRHILARLRNLTDWGTNNIEKYVTPSQLAEDMFRSFKLLEEER